MVDFTVSRKLTIQVNLETNPVNRFGRGAFTIIQIEKPINRSSFLFLLFHSFQVDHPLFTPWLISNVANLLQCLSKRPFNVGNITSIKHKVYHRFQEHDHLFSKVLFYIFLFFKKCLMLLRCLKQGIEKMEK